MTTTDEQSPVPTQACLNAIEIIDIGNLAQKSCYVIVSVDNHMVVRAEKKKTPDTVLRWEWREGHQFGVHPSSTIKIEFNGPKKMLVKRNMVGEFSIKLVELLHRKETIFELKGTDNNPVVPKLKIELSLASLANNDFIAFMEFVDESVGRLSNSSKASSALTTVGKLLQITKNVMNAVSDVHPAVKASWLFLSAAYNAVKEVDIQDEAVRNLAETLRETLGLANEHPELLKIEGTTDVIQETGRLSLEVSSLIYEYAKPNFIRRIPNLQLSSDLKGRIEKCQNSCGTLQAKFENRLALETNAQVKDIKTDAVNIKSSIDIVKNRQLAEEIKKWLNAPDSSPNYNAALEKRQAGTCEWFLNGELFAKFIKTPSFVWLNGNGGCGKTVLAAAIMKRVIEFCNKMAKQPMQKTAYARFLFDGRDSQAGLQHHDKFLCSLIWQLSNSSYWDDGIPSTLVELYDHGRSAPSVESLENALQKLIGAFDSVYIIVDSLDECVERKELLEWIQQVTSTKHIVNLHMLIVSRPEVDIQNVLQPLMLCVNLADVPAVNRDVSAYINDAILPLTRKWGKELAENVRQTLISGAAGTFRWVSLQILELEGCSSPQEIQSQLKSLPKDLNGTYDRILQKVPEKARDNTKTFLHFLCFAARPMTLDELAEVATVDFHPKEPIIVPHYTASRRYMQPRDVLQRCSGFVVESPDGAVKLAHFSVKEYLLSDYLKTPKKVANHDISYFHIASKELAHAVIAQTCLAYLLQFNTSESLTQAVLKSSHLARYAASNWLVHAKSGGIDNLDSSPTLVLSQNLFTQQATFTNYARIWDIDHYWRDPDLKRTPIQFALYYTASAGLEKLSQYLLNTLNVDVNATGGHYGGALQAAACCGYLDIVRLLCEHGAGVNMTGGRHGNALQAAAFKGHLEIVGLLCEHGANVNATGGEHGTALQAAVFTRNLEVIRLLCEHGADVNTTERSHRSALYAAAIGDNPEVVRLLCEHGANVNATGESCTNALYAAASRGNLEVIRLLCEFGADLNMTGGQYGSALQAAAYCGYLDVVKLLCEQGANVHTTGGRHGSALQAAAFGGFREVVRLLCEYGANMNTKGGRHGSALQAAAFGGHLEVVRFLCEHGADVNTTGGQHGNAVQAAALGGYLEVVRLLCEHGADVNTTEGLYRNALQVAAYCGHLEVVRLLFDHGADVNAMGGTYETPLQVAAYRGDLQVVRILCELGADVNIMGGKYGTALQAAMCSQLDFFCFLRDVNFRIVEYLLEQGANVNAPGPLGTALEIALEQRPHEITELLQQHVSQQRLRDLGRLPFHLE